MLKSSGLLARTIFVIARVAAGGLVDERGGARTGFFDQDVNTVDKLLELLPEGVEEAANSLGLRVKQQPKLEEIMREANRRLVEENISYQELTWKLERALAEKERLAIQLQEANEQLEQLALQEIWVKVEQQEQQDLPGS